MKFSTPNRFVAFALATLLVVASCSTKESIVLNGNLESAVAGDTVLLQTNPLTKEEAPTTIATLITDAQGKFTYTSKELEPNKYRLAYKNDKFILFLDFGTTNVKIAEKIAQSEVTGNPTDSLVRLFDGNATYNGLMMMSIAMMNMKYQKQGEEMPDSLLKSSMAMLEALKTQKEEIQAAAIEQGGLALAYIASSKSSDPFDLDKLNAAYEALTPRQKASYYGQEFKEALFKLNHLALGAVAPDFTSTAPDGSEVNFHQFVKGKKVVLIDFWASWCGPCRRENPNVKALYEATKEKGFDILAVSLDESREEWLKAIEKDGLTWTHVSDLGGWQEKTASLFNVTAVPATFLVDGDAKIIAINLRGEELKEKVLSICN